MAVLLAFGVLLALSAPAFAQSFGTGTDIYWSQWSGNFTANYTASPSNQGSDPVLFSVDGLWYDTMSMGYSSAPTSAGAFPSINWSTSSVGGGSSGDSSFSNLSSPPAGYPSVSPNPYDPGYVPGTSQGATASPTNVDVVFAAQDGTNHTDIRMNTSPTVQGIYFNEPTGTTELTSASSNATGVTPTPGAQTLTIGSDGLTVESNVKASTNGGVNGQIAVILGPGTPFSGGTMTLALSASQTWSNLSPSYGMSFGAVGATGASSPSGASTAPGGNITVPGTSPVTLTFQGNTTTQVIGGNNVPGAQAINNLDGAFIDNHTNGGTLSIVVDGGGWQFGNSSTNAIATSNYTGGLTINGGLVKQVPVTAGGVTTGGAPSLITVNGTSIVGGTWAPSPSGAGTYTNPLNISGVGAPGPMYLMTTTNSTILSVVTTYGTSVVPVVGYNTLGAVSTMNNGSSSNNSLVTLNGGVTLAANALIEASYNPFNLASSAGSVVDLHSYVLTMASDGVNRFFNVSAPIVDTTGNPLATDAVVLSAASQSTNTLSGANNYSGTTYVNEPSTTDGGGTVVISGPGNPGGGAYNVSGQNTTGSSPVYATLKLSPSGSSTVVASTVTLYNGATLDLTSGTLSLSGGNGGANPYQSGSGNGVTIFGGAGSGNTANLTLTNGTTLLNGNTSGNPIDLQAGLVINVVGTGSFIGTIDTTGGNITSEASIIGNTTQINVQGGNTLTLGLTGGPNAGGTGSTYGGGTNILWGTVLIGGSSTASAGPLGNPADGPIDLGDSAGDGHNASLLTNGAYTLANNIDTEGGTSGTLRVGGNTATSSAFSGASTGILLFNPLTISQVTGGSLTIGDAIDIGSSGTQTITFTPAGTGSVNVSGAIAGTGGTANIVQNGTGTTTLSGANTFNGNSITVSNGTLAFSNSVAPTGSGVSSVSVASGGTLQLAGSANALSPTSNPVNITTHGTGASTDGALSLVGNTSQTVGLVTGDPLTTSPTPATYSGNTTVGDGTNVASLTAAQILQNTLTINGSSTVVIVPGTPGNNSVVGASNATTASSTASADSSSDAAGGDSSSDPLTAIQDAIASGSISSAAGEGLENRIAAIEQAAAKDPSLDVSLLESRVLGSLQYLSSLGDSSTPSSGGASLLAMDSSAFGSSSGSTLGGELALGGGAGPASVPEPSTLILAAMGLLGVAFSARRRSRSRS